MGGDGREAAEPMNAADRLRKIHGLRAEHGTSDFDYDDDDVAAALDRIDALEAENARMREEQRAWYQRLRHAFRSGWDARGEVMAAAGGFMEAENRGQAYIAQLINMGALDATPQQPECDTADGGAS